MSTLLFAAAVAVLLGGALLWAGARARRLRAEAEAREASALAAMLGHGEGTDGETILGGLPSRTPARGGIEVAEMAEVVDLDALLAGEPGNVANRARAQLEEPTNIDVGGFDTMPLLPARAPLSRVAPRAVPRAMPPAAPRVVPPAPAAPRPAMPNHGAVPAAVPAPALAPTAFTGAASNALTSAPPARPTSPAPKAAESAAATMPAAAPAATAPLPRPVAGPPSHPGHDVPLRELALAWFEARGYRSAPASAAVRPIELVLRHKDDPARAYAFVVESSRVSNERVQNLRGQARAIGLVRLLIVASGGAAPRAAEGFKGVRLMDRTALETEFKQLDFSIAAKIIAVARKRSGALAAVS